MEDLLEFKALLEDAQEKGVAIFGDIVKPEFGRLFGAVDYRLAAFEVENTVPISAEEHEIEILAAATAHTERVKAEIAEKEAEYAEAIKTADQTKIDLMAAQNKANVIAGVVDAIGADGSATLTNQTELEKVVDELTTGGADDVIEDSAIDEAPALEIPKGRK